MDDFLAKPETEDALYLARGADVEPFRPVLQGDVFREIVIPGVGVEHDHAMVIAHPCSLRKGASLLPRIQMVPVASYQRVPFHKWPDSHLRVFPLPAFAAGAHGAALFEETGMVASAELTFDRRVAILSETGLLVLQQRYVHHLTRAVMQLERLERACGHVLAEAELQEEWCSDLVPQRVQGGEPAADALAAETEAFHAVVTAKEGGDPSVQEMLEEPVRRGDARRRVREEIARLRDERAEGNRGR